MTNQASKDLLKIIANTNLVQKLKTFKEFNLDYISKEDNTFSLQSTDGFHSLVNRGNIPNVDEILGKQIANQLFTLIPSLQRYYEFDILFNYEDQ